MNSPLSAAWYRKHHLAAKKPATHTSYCFWAFYPNKLYSHCIARCSSLEYWILFLTSYNLSFQNIWNLLIIAKYYISLYRIYTYVYTALQSKKQYLLTCKARGYCLLALHSSIVHTIYICMYIIDIIIIYIYKYCVCVYMCILWSHNNR